MAIRRPTVRINRDRRRRYSLDRPLNWTSFAKTAFNEVKGLLNYYLLEIGTHDDRSQSVCAAYRFNRYPWSRA